MIIQSHHQSRKFRLMDKAYHEKFIRLNIEVRGMSDVSDMTGLSPETIENILKRSSYSAIVRLSEKIELEINL